MCMLNKRAHILFDQQLWSLIVNLAKEESTSAGKLIRTAVAEKYTKQDDLGRIQKTVSQIRAFREKYGKKLAGKKDTTLIIRTIRNKRYGSNYL